MAFGGKVTLTVDERLWANAQRGCNLSNFILAHELGHVALNHHSKGAVTKNFQLFADTRGMMANIPPTVEELEANVAAVFFQCGVALLNPRWSANDLAKHAFSDATYVRKAQSCVKLEIFRRVLKRARPVLERVVL